MNVFMYIHIKHNLFYVFSENNKLLNIFDDNNS